MKYPKNELISDMSFKDYKEIKALNQSAIKEILDNPFFYANGIEKPRAESQALDFGSLMHDFVLSPDEIGQKYQIFSDIEKLDMRKKEHKEIKENAESKGLTIIDGETYKKARELLELNGDLFDALFSKGFKESVYLSEVDGIDCKVRFDFIDENKNIIDLKFVRSSRKADFIKAVANFGYHIQAKFYSDIVGARSFIFCAVEKEYPYMVGLYQLAPEALEFAGEKIKQAFDIVKNIEKYKRNVWIDDDLPDEISIQTITLPTFAFYE